MRLTTVTTRLMRRRPCNCQNHDADADADADTDADAEQILKITHLCLLDAELTKAAEENSDDAGEHVPSPRPHI